MKNWELIAALSTMPAGAEVQLLVGGGDEADTTDTISACEHTDTNLITLVSSQNWVLTPEETEVSESKT
jgi:hypothetical protein